MTPTSRLLAALVLAAASGGCAHIPPDRYGVRSLELEGAEVFHPTAITNCLATGDRDEVALEVGVSPAGACGELPFEAFQPSVELFPMPWSEWPLFDQVVFDQDLERIRRWYAARGHFEAEVTRVDVVPEAARTDDILDEDDPDPGCERLADDEGCAVDIVIEVEEGRPTHVVAREIVFEGDEGLSDELRGAIREAAQLAETDRFDETLFQRSKQGMRAVLEEAGYGRAEVLGFAYVDRGAREARLRFEVRPGPRCVFGEVRVEGADGLDEEILIETTLIEAGAPYEPEVLRSAQRAVFALGAFAAVTAEPVIPDEGNVIDVDLKVQRARLDRIGFGLGVQGGVLETNGGFSQQSVPQWDLHGLVTYRHRNFLGGLRQLRIEERPRAIVLQPFPTVAFTPDENGDDSRVPRFGNLIKLELTQPGVFDPRTALIFTTDYDFGPDPFDLFFRHRILSGVRLERSFLRRERLFVSLGLFNEFYLVVDSAEELEDELDGLVVVRGADGVEQTFACPPIDPNQIMDGRLPELVCPERERPANYNLMYLEQRVRLDFRDNPARPHAGFLAQVVFQEAGYFLPSSWDYIRILPEARFYIPLPFQITLAGRFALGMLFITGADGELPTLSQDLGPRNFRLRGGGASSNRGFLPGELGDGLQGGTRLWEASLELRVPITENLELAAFADAGDVSRDPRFRFDHLQLSVGGGLRYYTILGAIRIDFAFRVAGAQFLGADERDPGARVSNVEFPLFSEFADTEWPGAVHITIGNPF